MLIDEPTILSKALTTYYKLKVWVYKMIVSDEAASYVLYESIRPDIVLRMFGAKIGKNVRINRGLLLHETNNSFANLSIGDDVHIGKFAFIDLSGKVTIGNRVGIGMFAKILTHQNLGDSHLKEVYPKHKGDIEIPDDVVISAGSIILFPTKLAKKTLVSAGSVVRGAFDSPCVLIGNPARPSLNIKFKEMTDESS
jgi:acetyltransferase-like isoleucine patch superfamily enzyme